jgi:hypothetical protein
MSMLLVFMLVVTVNGDIDPNASSYWYSVTRCRWFAQELTAQGTYRKYNTPVFAYCVPKYKDPAKTTIHN